MTLSGRARGLATAVHAALGLVAGACGAADAPAPVAISTPGCPMLAEVVRRFGATMRGGGPAPLGAYFAAEGGRTVIRAPLATGCAQTVARALDEACRASAASGWCRSDASLASCVVAVQGIFEDPTFCGVCGDGVCSGSDRAAVSDGAGGFAMACPDDCRCGDGRCDPGVGEDALVCPEDCPSACGDGLCTGMAIGSMDLGTGQPTGDVVQHYEVCGSCDDVPGRPAGCTSCAADCCDAPCGDGVCQPQYGETRASCEQDCGLGFCGDHVCLGREDEIDCPADCHLFGYTTCLEPACREASDHHPSPCRDPRETCGDGVCMGCEMWTCAFDCARAPFVCAAHDASCPAGSCGDGVCQGTAESFMTCPLDCPYEGLSSGVCGAADGCDPMQAFVCPDDCAGAPEWCGDGICNRWEDATSCPGDCRADAGGCGAAGACAADGRRCADVLVAGPVTGIVARRHAVVGCADGCRPLEVCADLCVQDGGRARCVDCGSPDGLADGSCASDAAPRRARARGLPARVRRRSLRAVRARRRRAVRRERPMRRRRLRARAGLRRRHVLSRRARRLRERLRHLRRRRVPAGRDRRELSGRLRLPPRVLLGRSEP